MRHLRIILQIIFFTVVSQMSAAKTNAPELYLQWMDIPSKTLLNMAMMYVDTKDQPDSALICLSIIGNRDKAGISNNDKIYIIASYNLKWYVYFFFYFDYAKSYESLKHALDLCDGIHHNKARVFLNFGCMYQTMSEQSHDQELGKKAYAYYMKSFSEAKRINDKDVMFNCFANLVNVTYTLNKLQEIKGVWQYINRLMPKDHSSIHQYDELMYHGMCFLKDRKYDDAIAQFIEQLDIIGNEKDNIRYECVAYINISKAYQLKSDYKNATRYGEIAEKLAEKFDMKDAKIETYYLLAQYYQHLDMTDMTEKYRNKYFRIKDTLLNYHQLASVSEMQFLDKIKAIDDRMAVIKHRSEIKTLVAELALGFAFVIVLFLIVVFRKNKKLKNTNESLYKKNVEMLHAEEMVRQERHEKERLLAEIKPEKYKSSPLQDNSKGELINKILNIFENTEVMCAQDFSAVKLAELTMSKYNYVSQVINEHFGCNFNALLNVYRIKEACKRINDIDQYGNYTIEAIAQSVGYNSTNSFRAAFRKATGLSPSEYQKIARDKTEK